MSSDNAEDRKRPDGGQVVEETGSKPEPMISRRNALKAAGALAFGGGTAAAASRTDEGQNIINQLLGGGQGSGAGGGNQTETPTDTPEQTPTETPEPIPEIDELYQPEELNQMRQTWLEEAAYNELLQTLENTEEGLDGNERGIIFPNWEEGDYGHWDKNEFKQEDDIETILSWIQAPIRLHQQEVDGGPASSARYEFATTQELGINKLHPKAEIRTASVGSRGYGDRNNHGLYHAYIENIEEFDTDIKWWVLDTTSNGIAPIWDSPWTEGNASAEEDSGQYNPFCYGYDPNNLPNGVREEDAYNVARGGLVSLVAEAAGIVDQGFNTQDIYIERGWMTEAYDHALNNGEIEPILEPVEKAVQGYIETEQPTRITGTLEDTQFEWA